MPFSPTDASTAVPPGGSGPTTGLPPGGRWWPRQRRRWLLRTLGALALLGLFTPLGAAADGTGPSGPPEGAEEPPPLLSDKAFADLLRDGDLEQLDAACRQSADADLGERLRQLQQRLLTLHPAPQPLEVVLANADVLLSCRAPSEAMDVLNRFGPAAGAERVQWLQLQWRAASAGLDHRRAALALERLRQESGTSLDGIALPLLRREDGTVISRSALELLALHLESRGFPRVGGELLVRARQGGLAGALRLQQAVGLLAELPAAEREALLEAALDQAAAAGAWGLVAELLDTQAVLPSGRAVERRLRLSGRLDDAYGEWRWRREDPASAPRTRQLEIQLRSPRDPGGHAADLPAPATEPAPTTTPAP